MDADVLQTGYSRGRSESTLITRTGNLERRSQLGLTELDQPDNGPRVSSMKAEPDRERSASQGSQFDPVVRLVDSVAQEQARQLSENFEQFLDLGGGGIDISEFSLSDMEMQMGAGGEASRQPSNTSLRNSGSQARDSSGIEVYQFTKAELQRIGGLKEIMAANPEAFPCHKVKKTQKPTQYNVIAFAANSNGQQCVMEAIPLPDSGTPLYQCGYCRSVKSSSSAGADGRVRIRCECGGKHKDGKARMHANWNLVKASTQQRQLPGVPENQRMGLKGTKMPANTRTVTPVGFGAPQMPAVETGASGIERISGGHGRISDDVFITLE
eukprot:TRINITY_DN4722_c0_g1_i2.p1 TRINITY_DN4722_c0_g1~~TRINITY_DN4722_c0_g1_i2.p1  ORF type:complete len:326 (-),score=73.53 TRINITY_DN4722_c0_g1_i2:284-1261(-)